MIVEYQLDILKPHQPSNDILARTLASLEGVNYVAIKTDEIDQHTTSVFITIKGNDSVSLDGIKKTLEENNCALHSVDSVIVDSSK